MSDRRTRRGVPVAAVIMAAALALLLLLVWLRRPAPVPEPVVVEPPPAEPALPPGSPPVLPAAPGVAAFEAGVERRLKELRPVVRPAIGPIRVRMEEIALDDPASRPVIRVAALVAIVDGAAVLRGDLIADRVTVVRPVVTLERRPDEVRWNIERALARMTGPEPADGLGRVLLTSVAILDGQVHVRSPEARFRFEAVQAQLSRVLLADPVIPDPLVDVARLATTVVVPADSIRLPVVAQAGRLRFPPGLMEFDVARITAGESLLVDARGEWVFAAPGLGIRAQVRAAPLRFADVRFLIPELPPAGEAAFLLALEPVPVARTELRFAELVATTPEPASEVRGALRVVVGGPPGFELVSLDLRLQPLALALLEPFTGPLPYDGVLLGRLVGPAGAVALDLVARLTAPDVPDPFDVGLTGTVGFVDAELVLHRLVAQFREVPLLALRPLVPWLPLEGLVSGQVVLRGPPAREPLELDVLLALAEGTLTVAGILDLTGPVPAYDLAGDILQLRLDELLEPEVPPVALTARFALAGRGVAPEEADARLHLAGRFSGWRAQPADTIVIRAALAAGRLHVDTVAVALATLRLDVGGAWRVVAPAGGGLTYRASVDDLEPWGPYLPGLPPEVAGRLRTAGILGGPVARPRLAGTAEGEDLEYLGWFARTAAARYALDFAPAVPDIDVDVTAEDISSPDFGDFATASVRFRRVAPFFALTGDAERADDGGVAVRADGIVLPDGTHDATLHVLTIDTPEEERWELAAPARLRWGGPLDILVVRDLVLEEVEAEGRILVDGRWPPAPADGLVVQLTAVRVGPIWALTGVPAPLTGMVTADVEVLGPPEAPVLRSVFQLEDGEVDGVAYDRIEGTAHFAAGTLTVDAAAVVEGAAPILVEAELPAELTVVPPSIALVETRPLRATLVADSLPLEVVERWSPDMRDAGGLMTVDVEVTGTVAAPVLAGRIRVMDGEAEFPAVEQRYTQITADLVLEDRVVRIDTLRARSAGWAFATGYVVFEELDRPVAELELTFDGFRALGFAERQDAAAFGTLTVTGPLFEPVVAGRIRLDEGDFSVPAVLPRPDPVDPFVAVAEPAPVVGAVVDPVAPVPWMRAITLDSLVVVAGDDLWVTTEEFRAQLSGELTLFMEDAELTIFGTLAGTRGTFTLRVGPIIRRFTIVEAEIQFLGLSPPDPAIAVTASRLVFGAEGRRTEILAQIGGTLSAPTLALATPDAVMIPESELLSFILFGQPTFALGDGVLPGAALLEDILVAGLAELATIELEDALLRELGLPFHQFQIRPAPGAVPWLGASSLIFGVEVADDVFVTVESGLGTLFGPTEGIVNVWSVLVDWQIDREWSASLGFEPVARGRLFRGLGVALPTAAPDRQFTGSVRRRWTY